MTAFWHPFADMGLVEQSPMTIVRGADMWVWYDVGTRYLDATASLWCGNVGHRRPEIAEAAGAQLRELDSYSCFGDFTNLQAERVCERLAAVAAEPGSKVFLGSGGGDLIWCGWRTGELSGEQCLDGASIQASWQYIALVQGLVEHDTFVDERRKLPAPSSDLMLLRLVDW